MRASLLASTLAARTQAHIDGKGVRPAYIVGPPGIGKTAITKGVAETLGIGLMTVHAPIMLAEDYGMPRLEGTDITFATPGKKFPFVDNDDCPDTGILDIEEVPQASPDQQKILANLFLEREVHGRPLKKGWYIISTGNRMQDRAGAGRILSHFNDRFTTYELDVSLDDWADWALNNGVRPEVVYFLKWRPDLLSKFDPAMEKNPTPRSWTQGVSPALDVVPEAALFDTIKGDVGEGPAAEFKGFLSTYQALPNVELVFTDPDRAVVPTETHVCFAMCGAVASRATVDNFAQIMTYAKRMRPEFQVLLVRDAAKVCPAVIETRAFTQWSIGDGARILMSA